MNQWVKLSILKASAGMCKLHIQSAITADHWVKLSIFWVSAGMPKLCNPFYAPHMLLSKHTVKKKELKFCLLMAGSF
jgi:hypothetical protein